MHNHRKTEPELTAEQREVIEANRKAASARRSSRSTVTSQVDPFDLLK